MASPDEFSSYIAELLLGSYDCVDRIALRAYFRLAQTSGGFLTWWHRLLPGEFPTHESLRRMAGDFARRVKAFSQKHKISLQYCELGDKTKYEKAEKARPKDPDFQGVFLILVARAPAPVWQIKKSRRGKLLIRRAKNWPLVNHYHFHILDKEWGHISFRMSGHPPFGAQILLNGHEWLERQARKEAICYSKQGNCFVGGSDLPALNSLAAGLAGSSGLVRLAGSLRSLDLLSLSMLWLNWPRTRTLAVSLHLQQLSAGIQSQPAIQEWAPTRPGLSSSNRSNSQSAGCAATENHFRSQTSSAEK
jgi:hypothetical protein